MGAMLAASIVFVAALQNVASDLPIPPPSMQEDPVQPASDDIVVTALRDIEAKDSAVTMQTLGSLRTGSAVRSRSSFELAQRWANCAVRAPTDARREWLRKAIDLRPNSTLQAFAMRRLAQINAPCAADTQNALKGKIIDPYYDRGALVIEALKTFAPKLQLTRRETRDTVVQARFNAREIPLTRFRLPVDQRYFETALCLVRLQPELSVRLVMTDRPLDTIRRLEAAIVNRGRVCVGNARHVYFDGTQFRFYIGDAVYRWAVAAQGVATLIPRD